MYGLTQAGLLAQELLEQRLQKQGYTQSKVTLGFWTHTWRPISFTLVVDDSGVSTQRKLRNQRRLGQEKIHWVDV